MDSKMAGNPQGPHARHIAQVVQVVNDILQAQVAILERIEAGYQENLQVYHELQSKVELLDKKIEGGFTVLEQNRIANLDKRVSEKLKNIQYKYLIDLKLKIDTIHSRLQQQVQALMLQTLIKGSHRPIKKPVAKAPTSGQPSGRRPSSQRPISGDPAPAAAAAAAPVLQAPIPEPEGEEDWMESELEGAEIFDTIITTWKRRDWEEIQGTKEIFMRGWRKLSNSDRQKIRNGAWSKKIMNKIKLLGRSS